MSLQKGKITFEPATLKDSEFVYSVKKAALRAYIEQTWGWDEEFQRRFHREHFDPSEAEIILVDQARAGYMIVKEKTDHIMFATLHIHPDFQHRGYGTNILKNAQEKGRAMRLPVRLRVLKVNPALSLYERLGFTVTSQSNTHFDMEWRADS